MTAYRLNTAPKTFVPQRYWHVESAVIIITISTIILPPRQGRIEKPWQNRRGTAYKSNVGYAPKTKDFLKLRLFTACRGTVVQAVVKANSQSNGKGQISTSWNFETPERISMKLGTYSYVVGMTNKGTHVVLWQRGWSGRTRDMTSAS